MPAPKKSQEYRSPKIASHPSREEQAMVNQTLEKLNQDLRTRRELKSP